MTWNQDNIEAAKDILDKRYELYSWCEDKTNTLATINSILLAGIFGLASSSGFGLHSVVHRVEYIGALAAIGVSMVIVLWHIEPTMSSQRRNKSKNIRSVVGVRNHSTREDYRDALRDASPDVLVEAVVVQIYGMNKNIWRNQLAIKYAVLFDVVGLAIFAAAAISALFH